MVEGDTTTTTTTTTAPWYQGVAGVDSETIGHWTNKGWHTKTAPEVALEATKAWKEAERFVGAPANELLRMPKDAKDEAGWSAIWTRLGKPTEAKGYDFADVKRADGTPADENLLATIRATAFNANLPKDAAAALAREVVKYQETAAQAETVERQAKVALERTELAKNWGQNFEANKFVATRAAAALGVEPATVAALENQVGYAKVMEMFRQIGSKIGEDKFVTSTTPGGVGVMTRDQAAGQKAELMKDKAWAKSYLEGDSAKVRQMTALNTIIVGTQG